jgi:uncharacterized protein (TIRG00374 family)
MLKFSKVKSVLAGLGKAALALGLLYWLYQKGVLDLRVLRGLLRPTLLLAAMGILVLNFFLATWRWQMLLKVQKLNLTRWECFKLNLVGLFFNYVMPGGVGGDVVKAFYIVKDHPRNRMGAGMSVLLDRVMGLYAMLLLAIVSLLINLEAVEANPQLLLITKGLMAGLVVFTLALGLALSERFRQWGWQKWLNKNSFGTKLVSAYEAIYSYSHHLSVIGWAILLSLLSQVLAIVLIWWLGENLGFDGIPIGLYFAVVPIGFMVTAVPISPAGVGVGQMAFFFLFNLFLGHESQVGPAVITAFQVLNFLLGLSGIWFFVQRKSAWKEVEGALGS